MSKIIDLKNKNKNENKDDFNSSDF